MPAKWVPKREKPKITEQVRMKGCPAYPSTGFGAGAPRAWCLSARGNINKCEKCDWGNHAKT